MGPYLELFDSEKSRVTKIKMTAKELTNLWKSLKFPIVSHQQVQSKTRALLIFMKNIEKEKQSK